MTEMNSFFKVYFGQSAGKDSSAVENTTHNISYCSEMKLAMLPPQPNSASSVCGERINIFIN